MTIDKTMKRIASIFTCILLAACVTAVDELLPYAELPAVTVATEVTLVASPAHPTAYLTSEPIPAGETVQVIGADESAAWLLVLHDNLLGWMPTFYSRTNVATLTPALVVEPLSDKCTKYLDATFAPDEAWVSNMTGAAFVIGSIYRAQTEMPFDEAALDIEIEGGGAAVESDYVHTPLTSSRAVVLFGFSVASLRKGSRIHFNLANTDDEALSFQAAFFSNECTAEANHLPIGKTKVTVAQQDVSFQTGSSALTQPTPAATPTPAIIRHESGPTSSKPSGTPTPSAAEIAAALNMELVYQNDFEEVIGVEWSKPVRDTAPNKQGFLGQFGNEVVMLSLTDISEHAYIFLVFDLYLIRTWDGIHPQWGPDTWDLNVAGGPTLLHTTFSNSDPLGNVRQSYPDPYPGGNQPARTAAAKNNVLGYKYGEYKLDSVYNLSFDFAHSASTLELNFSASGLQALDDESWGIDNIEIYIRK